MKRLLILLGVLVAVAGLGLTATAVGGAVTSAQEGDGPLGSFLAKVADKLGISEDELQGAISEAQLEMVDEAEAEGRITLEQAERLRDRVEGGGTLFPLRPPHHRHHRPGAKLIVSSASQVLDMETAALADELKAGKSLAEVAEAQGMDVEEFKFDLLEQISANLEDKVNEALQRIEENIDQIINATGKPGPGRCGPGGHHGPTPPDQVDTTQTSSEITL